MNGRIARSRVVPAWKRKCCTARRNADGSSPIIAGGCGPTSIAVIVFPSQRNCVESGVCAPDSRSEQGRDCRRSDR